MTGLDIRDLRIALGQNQFEFADMIGIDRRTLQRAEARESEKVTKLLAWACRGVKGVRK